jgi:hypothetical protein
MAHDWDHDGDGWRHEQHDHGWYKHHGDDDEDEEEEEEHEGRDYRPFYGYHQEPGADDFGYGYGSRGYGWNGSGMVNRRHPGLIWACDSQGHHCRWVRRYGWNRGYGERYYGNNGYYGTNSPLGGLGPLLGIPLP